MGSSHSQTVTTANTNILNSQNISNTNIYESTVSKMNEATVNAFQSASKSAGATIHTSQSNTIGNVIASGRGSVVNANVSQKINTAMNFTGVQVGKMKSDIIAQAAQAASEMLQTEFTAKSDSNLKASGSTNSQAQATATPFALGASSNASSTSNTNTNVTNIVNVRNETQTKISEFMSNKLNTEIKQEDVQTCMTNLAAMQNTSTGNLVASDGGIVNFESSQGIDAALNAQCKQLTDAMTQAVADFKQSTDFVTTNSSDAAVSAKVSAESTATGSSIAKSELGLGSSPSSASMASSGSTMIIPIIIAIVILCCLCSLIKSLMSGGSGGGGGNSGNTE